MSELKYTRDELKRKIRSLKKLELKIRFGNMAFVTESPNSVYVNKYQLIWDEFFNLNENKRKKVRYSISTLETMSREEYKEVISEFIFNVYYESFKEKGVVDFNFYDPKILTQLGLPYNADSNDIKKRFRELAKKYHPDTGGDSEKFIELMEIVKSLNY